MQMRSRELLKDIQTYSELAARITNNGLSPVLELDLLTRLAVERCFENVGEALSRLERHDPVLAERISSVRRIIGFRNQIAHGYDTVDFGAVDTVLREHLPILRREVAELLEEAS